MDRIREDFKNDYKELMNRRDEVTPPPAERAEFIFDYLQEHNPKFTMWDLTCFATEFLAVASHEIPTLQPAIKDLISKLYTAHYHVGEPFASSVREANKRSDEPNDESLHRSIESASSYPRDTVQNDLP